MSSYPLPFDVCERRHKGNQQSAKANQAVHRHKASARERVRVFVAACDFRGATVTEIAATLQHPTNPRSYFPNEISGRLTELVMDRQLFKSARVRQGAVVYVSRPEWVGK